MNELSLIKSEPFGSTVCDFYQNDDQVWMTREQIGMALGYADPMVAVGKIHDRHQDRLDKFSFTTLVNGRNTYFYSAKGVYEICRWSRQPKADDFMDFSWDVIEKLRTGQLTSTVARRIGKAIRKELTDIIQESGIDDKMHGFGYKTITDLAYKLVFGKNAKQLKAERMVGKGENLRDKFSAEEIARIEEIENSIGVLINLGNDYQQIKAILGKRYLTA